MIRRLILTAATLALLISTTAFAQNQPLPRPVTPPSPNPGAPTQPPAAASAAPAAPHQPAAGDSILAGFVDSQTLAVARFDLKAIDLKATEDWVLQAADELRKNHTEIDRAQTDIRQSMHKPIAWVEKFRDAGADTVYAVVSFADLTENRPPFFVIPLGNHSDGTALKQMFPEPAGAADGDRLFAQQIGGAIVIAARDTLKRLQVGGHVEAVPAQLATALEAAGTGPVRLAFIPQQGVRTMFESLVAKLPDELGGGPVQILSRGMQWASLSIDLPPNPSLKLVIDATNPAAAAQLNDVANKAIDWAATRKQGPPGALAFASLVTELKPRVEGNRLVAELNGAQTRQLAATVASGFLQARVAAARTQSQSNLRQLMVGVDMYANSNRAELPKDLGEIGQYLGGDFKQLWIDPLRPHEAKPYVYVRPAGKLTQIKSPDDTVMIYENHSTWDDGINVAFADGHVEWIADEKRFKQMLEDTKKNNPGSVEMPQ